MSLTLRSAAEPQAGALWLCQPGANDRERGGAAKEPRAASPTAASQDGRLWPAAGSAQRIPSVRTVVTHDPWDSVSSWGSWVWPCSTWNGRHQFLCLPLLQVLGLGPRPPQRHPAMQDTAGAPPGHVGLPSSTAFTVDRLPPPPPLARCSLGGASAAHRGRAFWLLSARQRAGGWLWAATPAAGEALTLPK